MTQTDDWSASFTKRIAQEIRLRRGRRSAKWLSDRTEHFGHRVGRARISDLETGRRTRIDVGELFVLARALDTVPLLLLFPGIPNTLVDVLPGVETTSWDAALWTSGEQGLHSGAAVLAEVALPEDVELDPRVRGSATHRLLLMRLHDQAVRRLEDIADLEFEAGRPSEDGSASNAEVAKQRDQAESDVRELRLRLMHEGVELPPLPDYLAHLRDVERVPAVKRSMLIEDGSD